MNDSVLYSLVTRQTPCYVIDEAKIEENCKILSNVMEKTGARILLAQKAFSFYPLYPLIGKYLSGSAASGLYEARLGAEEMGGETHVFSGAYRDSDMPEISKICDHIVFNSVNQLMHFKDYCLSGNSGRKNEIGIRINPELSTQEGHEIYDPCAPGSRLGITLASLEEALDDDPTILDGVTGFHFHTLCEQGAEPLKKTADAVIEKFGPYLSKLKWINLGGGHHITKPDYNIDLLIEVIKRFQDEFGLTVYLEPGEAVALNAGYLVTEIIDKTTNGDVTNLILDTSAACHMPDVLEMPYRPPLFGSGKAGVLPFTYRLGSATCLSGDVIGDYSFPEKKEIGDKLIFEDMAIYSFVKNNTFNGMPLPSLIVLHKDSSCETIKQFGYEDFKMRLG